MPIAALAEDAFAVAEPARPHLGDEPAVEYAPVANFPLTGGKATGWAAGIVYSVGWINIIGDPSQPHHMKSEDMAPALGVSPATLMNRARDIHEGLGLRRMDPRWSTKAMLERNPLLRMAEYLGGDEGGV